MHVKVARRENLESGYEELKVSEIDDHDVHIAEHTVEALNTKNQKLLAHIKEHRKFQAIEKTVETED